MEIWLNNTNGEKFRTLREEGVLVPLCQPWTPRGLVWDQTQASAACGRRQAACAMARSQVSC